MNRSLGIDFGGVVVPRFQVDGDLTELLNGTLQPRTDAFRVLHKWNQVLEGRVWLVSKASPATRRAMQAWLVHNGFEWHTGIDQSRWIFVPDREGKRAACEQHQIGVFVDDQKQPVLLAASAGAHPILFMPRVADSSFDQVWNWEDLDHRLGKLFAEARQAEGSASD